MSERNWDRLPRWARDEYDRAVRERCHYEERLRALETEPGTECGEISHSDHRRPWRSIPRGDSVRLFLDDRESFVEVRVEPSCLRVTTRPDHRLVVLAGGGSNVVRIRVEGR